jgi:integrase
MRGHIRERSPGHWAIVIDARDPDTGQRKRKWHSFKGSKREAQVECARLIGEHKAGKVNLAPNKTTVAEFLARWLEHKRTQITPYSFERYEDVITHNIIPLIGNIRLAKLQPMAISNAYGKALTSGRSDGRGGLSPRTVHYMHRVLRQALDHAIRWSLIGRNPIDAVEPPKVERRPMAALDADATIALVEAARDTKLFIPVLLGVMCGLRRGEVAALRWRCVDLDTGTLSVAASAEQRRGGVLREKPPKSGRGRTVELPSLVVDELRRYRVKQAENLLRLGVRLSDDHHVVMLEDGSRVLPRSLTHSFETFLKTRKLPRMRLHDLRHTHASQMLKSGVHPKVAQERLGHSSIAITLDLYSHVMPGMQHEAAQQIDRAMRDALERAANKKG